MGFKFNVCEVFEMAEHLERNGAKFYRKISECFDDPDVRKTLLLLSDWELEHADKFAVIRKSFLEGECPPTVSDVNNEDILYLRAMASGHVFDVSKDLCSDLGGSRDERQVLQMAVGLEKEAIVFYLGLKTAVPTDAGKEKVELIIKDKMRHLGILNRELSVLKE